jgi:hypothetical protein
MHRPLGQQRQDRGPHIASTGPSPAETATATKGAPEHRRASPRPEAGRIKTMAGTVLATFETCGESRRADRTLTSVVIHRNLLTTLRYV